MTKRLIYDALDGPPFLNKRGFTREEAAEYLGVSVYKIRSAIRDNLLVAKKLGKDIIVLREDLDDWVETWETA